LPPKPSSNAIVAFLGRTMTAFPHRTPMRQDLVRGGKLRFYLRR
jgi:hypothetical protein